MVDELFGHGVGCGAHGKRKQRFVGMQARVIRVQGVLLQLANGFDDLVGNDEKVFIDARNALQGIHKQGRCRAKQVGGFAGDHAAVGQHHGARGCSGRLFLQKRRFARRREVRVDTHLVHEQLKALHLVEMRARAALVNGGGEIAAHDFHLRGIAACVVVANGEAGHIHAHVGGRLVGAFAQNAFEHALQNGEDLDVAVVVHGCDAVRLQMERVDRVRIVQIDRGGLVGDVHGMLQRQVPNGERLVFRIAGLNATLVLMVELREGGGHLARARAGCGYHDERARGFHEFVFAKTVIGIDARDIVGVASDRVVQIALHAERRELLAECRGGRLVLVARDNDAGRGEAHVRENIEQTQHVFVVGDAQVAAHLVFLDIVGVDRDDDFHVVGELLEHANFAVRLEAWQNAACVVVVKELSAELEVQLSAKLADALTNMFRLQGDIFVIVETDAHKASW